MPPNAYQSEGEDGRPNVTVGVTLLDEMRSDDEIAFVLSHEMSHHIAGHLPKQQQQQVLGALILGGLVAAAGNPIGGPASDQAISQAMDVGAYVGARSYSQTYELEADTLGAFIAARAGYDPERGAQIFLRPALANAGGPPILVEPPRLRPRQATVAARRRRDPPPAGPRPHPAPRPGRLIRDSQPAHTVHDGAMTDSIRASIRRPKNVARCILGLAITPQRPLDTPSPQRTGPVGSQRRGKTGQA